MKQLPAHLLQNVIKYPGSFFEGFPYENAVQVAALSCDLLQETGPLKILFKSDSFLQFIQNILNVPSLYRNVDPIGAVFVNIYKV